MQVDKKEQDEEREVLKSLHTKGYAVAVDDTWTAFPLARNPDVIKGMTKLWQSSFDVLCAIGAGTRSFIRF